MSKIHRWSVMGLFHCMSTIKDKISRQETPNSVEGSKKGSCSILSMIINVVVVVVDDDDDDDDDDDAMTNYCFSFLTLSLHVYPCILYLHVYCWLLPPPQTVASAFNSYRSAKKKNNCLNQIKTWSMVSTFY